MMAHPLTYAIASLCLLTWCSRGGSAGQASEGDGLGVTHDSAVVKDTLQPFGTAVWVFRFQALSPARLAVRTTAPADVQCRLFDTNGRAIPGSATTGYGCRFAWLPERTGAHRIEVRNAREHRVPYAIIVR